MGSEGIYRKSGQNSKITSLLEALKKDARSVVLKEEEHVDNVSDALKRFFRGIGEGVFAEHCMQWLQVPGEGAIISGHYRPQSHRHLHSMCY